MRLRCRKEGEPMRIFRTRKQFLVFFMPGFLLGIIYVNFIAAKYMAEPGIFSEYFLDQFDSVKIEAGEYIWYLLRVRVLPFLALAGIAFTKMRKAAAVLFLFWTGISGGILISTAVLNLGIRGSLLCLAGLVPQFFTAPQNRWNQQKTIFVILAMSVGILLELYVNPLVVKAFLSVF